MIPKFRFFLLLDRISSGVDQSVYENIYDLIEHNYSQPTRHYHTMEHVQTCLDLFEDLYLTCSCPNEIEFALWYHDVFYDPTAHDNEMRSAHRAYFDGTRLGVDHTFVDLVERLILATQHKKDSYADDEALVVDLDLAILGMDRAKFTAYEEGIRKEYSFVPEEAFRKGRSDILKGFLARKTIFNTAHFIEKYEDKARENLRFSIQNLSN